MNVTERQIWNSHGWEYVVSNHPHYQCSLCFCSENSPEAKVFCRKFNEALKREAEETERAERAEYDAYIKQQTRIDYLRLKYEK